MNSLGFGKMSPENAIKVIDTIAICQNNIESLHLGGNNLNHLCITKLSLYVTGNTTLRRINIQKNSDVTDQCIDLIIKMIQTSCVEQFEIGGTSITDENVLIPYLELNKIKNGANSLYLKW